MLLPLLPLPSEGDVSGGLRQRIKHCVLLIGWKALHHLTPRIERYRIACSARKPCASRGGPSLSESMSNPLPLHSGSP